MLKEIKLKLGEEELKFEAEFTPYTILFFEQSFDSDFFTEVNKITELLKEENYKAGKLVLVLLRLLYALTEGHRKEQTFANFLKTTDGRFFLTISNINELITNIVDLIKVSESESSPQK